MKIIWTDPAIQDLEAIRDFIARDSEYYAVDFIEKILESVDTLYDLPNIGRIAPEADRKDIRELLFYHYRIIYHIKRDYIYILAVIHGARELSMLKHKPWEVV